MDPVTCNTDMFIPLKRCCICNEDLSSKRGQNIQLAKIIVLAIIPLIVLLIQGGITVANDEKTISVEMKIADNIRFSVHIGGLIHNLQLERGTTVLYLSKNKDSDVFSDLQNRRLLTDKSVYSLSQWLSGNVPTYFRSGEAFYNHLQNYRDSVNNSNTTINDVIKWYSDVNDVIVGWIGSLIVESDYVTRWQPLIAYHMLLMSKEQAGIERALGSIFFNTGNTTTEDLLWYKEKVILGQNYLKRGMQYSSAVKKELDSRYIYDQLETSINIMRNAILLNNDVTVSLKTGMIWFDNMTSYIDILNDIEDTLAQDIISVLHDYINALKRDLAVNVLEMVGAIVMFPITVTFVYRLTMKLQHFANSLKDKTYDLEIERKRSEQLLHQMLPISIAKRMMKSMVVIPEYYESVTIYFSDIVGFTTICSKSSPMQVIYMMNLLYIMIDERIEAFDVYKVETIGDAYMVASGLPVQNRDKHAAEVALMSLDIMKTVCKAKVPHLPQEHWKIRIGVNTGSVVAGVVGTKMPRYCVFGDTVNVASRMESSGKQMDAFMKDIVDSYTNSKELENFVCLVGIENDSYVKDRIFTLMCQELFEMIDQDVQIPTPEPMEAEDLFPWIDWSQATPLIHQEPLIVEVATATTPTTLSENTVQNSTQNTLVHSTVRNDNKDEQSIPIPESQPGPSNPKYFRPWLDQEGRGIQSPSNNNTTAAPYTFRKKGERVFAKNKATEQTFEIKFNEEWKGDKLKDIHNQLHRMLDDVLDKARGDAHDLGRIVVKHGTLQNPIVVPLQQWEKLDSDVVMEGISKVLNSNEELVVDDSLEVNIGSISVPSGSGGNNLPVTSLFGPGNSLERKKSVFEIDDTDDHLCLAKSIGVCFLKTCKQVNASEWNELTRDDKGSKMELAVRHKTCPRHYYKNMLTKDRRKKMQTEMALELCRMAKAPTDRPLGLNDIEPFERLLDVNVLVISSRLSNQFVCVVDNPDLHNIFVYLVEYEDVHHFHGISSIAGFFGSSYFCEACLKPYSHKEYHNCETTCDVCTSKECTNKDPMSCRSCHRECRSNECFTRHLESKIIKKRVVSSQCDTWYKCRTCKKVMKYEEKKPIDHRCGEWKCRTCTKYHVGDHFCYQRAMEAAGANDKKFMFYDFETRQDDIMQCDGGYAPCEKRCEGCTENEDPCKKCRTCTNCGQYTCGLFKHVVNFAVLQSACKKCLNEDLTPNSKCNDCGRRCPRCWKTGKSKKFKDPPCPETCGFREQIFDGDDAAQSFCDYVLQQHCKDTILIAHNAKSFDLYPILEVLIDRHGVRPDKIIYNGSKVMYMHIAKKLNLTFIDSLNFIPMKLSKFPKTFGLTEMKKGYFPHLFNRKENQSYVGPYPSKDFYAYNSMSNEDDERQKFLKWYDENCDNVFDFRQEMLAYCRSDVDIVRRGCLCFRDVMLEATSKNGGRGIDPFDYVTIAGACMGIFKSLFLQEEHETKVTDENGVASWHPTKYRNNGRYILWSGSDDEWTPISKLDKKLTVGDTRFVKSKIGMVPTEGYSKRDNYSKSSIQWLEWVMEKKNRTLHIQHALNGGEYRIPGTNYRADGFDGTTVYEYHGCIFHGCKTCFPHDRSTTTHPTTEQSMEELYVVTEKRKTEIKRLGYKYKCIWEHEFHKNMREDSEMREFVSQLDVQDRLNPRDSFFGGRTNSVKLHHKVNKDDETIEYYDFTSLYPWTNKYCRYPVGHPTVLTENLGVDISRYFGIAKVKILPPRNLFHPVLPRTSQGKLKFPLCATCADAENPDPCRCTDEERAFVGTWCTPELEKAVEKGYHIMKTYEVYHFQESSQYDPITGTGGLFAEYVNTFLKIKQEASGWPEGCETEEQKREYIRSYKEKEGIDLDYDSIKKNPGLRFLAKQCLNSFWGKFGQRLGLKQSQFIHESEADIFFKMVSDPRKSLYDFHILTSDILQFKWSDDPLFLPLDTKTNIFIASFTIAWARLKLYSVLEEVGEDCLYMDTDSVIFVDRDRAHVNRLPIGNYLGELTNEIPAKDGHIVEYVSGGPKNYSFRTLNGKEVCKVRGFTLNFANSRLIHFDAVKELVVGCQKGKTITVTNPAKISRDARKRKLYNRKEEKQYKMVYTKRRLLQDMTTLPYGF